MSTLDGIDDPDSPLVRNALQWSCDICHQPAGVLCRNTIRADEPLPGRKVHHGRRVDRRKLKGDK